MLKASMTNLHARANAHRADGIMSIFVNELDPPHVRNQQGKCMLQCQTILTNTLATVQLCYMRPTYKCCIAGQMNVHIKLDKIVKEVKT